MYFNNVLIYKFTDQAVAILEEQMQGNEFTPCGRHDVSKYGWVAPSRDLIDQLVVTEGDLTMICAQREEKILPACVIRDKLRDKVEQIEHQEDRRVHRKEKEALKEEIIFDCLPQAFTKSMLTHAYIDHKQGLLVINASSAARAEELMKLLRGSIGSLPVVPVQTANSPSIVMTGWLQGVDLPESFELGSTGNLAEMREGGAKARLKNQELLAEEVSGLLEAGKRVEVLELDYDERITFKLHDDLAMKGLKFSEQLVSEAADSADGDKMLQFRADFRLMSAAIRDLYVAICEAFGGNRPDPLGE